MGFNAGSFREQFDMTISDTAQDNFDGYYVKEVTAAPGTNSCWWSGSGVPQNPGVQGLLWSVGTVAGGTEHNHWGYDSIAWDLSVLDNIVRNGPVHGVRLPRVTTIHQGMQIVCNAKHLLAVSDGLLLALARPSGTSLTARRSRSFSEMSHGLS
jgi:hypothetical protein